ncbi:hypothetical protein HOLleu_08705 [Holothuria leucospilota]|uniref:Uncharacterized protein n=1 Tax=Holothuria leucospilota TaxID=206669 RepID=A0A9Q1HH65_HOLLE|nr:hypothetical protein HOLleu_08705 [Holothuria leucospilota]
MASHYLVSLKSDRGATDAHTPILYAGLYMSICVANKAHTNFQCLPLKYTAM